MKMKKINKRLFALSTLICLLPVVLYLIVWSRLPEQMGMHWGSSGVEPSWTMPRAWAIFVLPVFLAIVHILVVVFVHHDPKREKQPKAMQNLIFWLLPIISIFANLVLLLMNLNENFPIGTATLVFVGLLFIILGNYMPKFRQNYTMGIRTPWALNNADNWNKTHRLGGVLFMLSGLLLVICAVLPLPDWGFFVLLGAAIVPVVVVPVLYSFVLYRRTEHR